MALLGGGVEAAPPTISEPVNTTACPTVAPTLVNGSFENFSNPETNPSVATGSIGAGLGTHGIWHGYANGPNQILFLKPGAGSGATENYVSGWKSTTPYVEIQRQVASYTASVDMNGTPAYSGPAISGAMTSGTTSQFDAYAPQPANGVYWAELNAITAGALYQDVEVPSSARLFWSIKHRGRRNVTDSMEVRIGPAGGSLATQTSLLKYSPTNGDKFSGSPTYGSSTSVGSISGNVASGWTRYEGTYDPDPSPSSPTRTLRFEFGAVGGATIGNLLDDIEFTPLYACPQQRSLNVGDTDTLDVTGPVSPGASTDVSYGLRHSLEAIGNASGPTGPLSVSGAASSFGPFTMSGNDIVFTPTEAGTFTIDYQVTMDFGGVAYAAASRITYTVGGGSDGPVTTTTTLSDNLPDSHPGTGSSPAPLVLLATLLMTMGIVVRRTGNLRRTL